MGTRAVSASIVIFRYVCARVCVCLSLYVHFHDAHTDFYLIWINGPYHKTPIIWCRESKHDFLKYTLFLSHSLTCITYPFVLYYGMQHNVLYSFHFLIYCYCITRILFATIHHTHTQHTRDKDFVGFFGTIE